MERPYRAAGGLISYGADSIDSYRRAASYVDREAVSQIRHSTSVPPASAISYSDMMAFHKERACLSSLRGGAMPVALGST